MHKTRKESVHLSIRIEDTARVILNKVCQHFKLDPSRHELCELDSAGGEEEGLRRNGRGDLGEWHSDLTFDLVQ